MGARKFKHSSLFETTASLPLPKESKKLLSKASVEELKTLLPQVAEENGWDDLLPIAGNACVVNYANKNRDAINTAAAVAIAPFFAKKFINVEHDRGNVIGFLESSSFTKFDPNYMNGYGSESIASTDAAKMTDPFNLALGGVIWRVVAPAVAAKIEECNDENSPDYLTLGMSWELGFDDYSIAIGPQTLKDCKIISDPAEVEAMSKYLVQNKGPGTLDDGTPVYRLLTETSGAVPLGIGLTFAPAAAVTGVITPEFEAKAKEIEAEIKEKVSQSTTTPVITTKPTTKLPISMKVLKTYADILALDDETKANTSLANIKSVLANEVKTNLDVEGLVRQHHEALEAEKAAKQKVIDDASANAAKATKEAGELTIKHENLQKQFNELLQKQTEAEATSKFNDRMGAIDEAYELDDAQRKSVADSIKGLDDTAYATWFTNFSNFANKSKKVAAPAKTEEDVKKEAAAAVEGAKKNQTTAAVNNNPTPAATSLFDRVKGGFTGDNAVKITVDSRRSR